MELSSLQYQIMKNEGLELQLKKVKEELAEQKVLNFSERFNNADSLLLHQLRREERLKATMKAQSDHIKWLENRLAQMTSRDGLLRLLSELLQQEPHEGDDE